MVLEILQKANDLKEQAVSKDAKFSVIARQAKELDKKFIVWMMKAKKFHDLAYDYPYNQSQAYYLIIKTISAINWLIYDK